MTRSPLDRIDNVIKHQDAANCPCCTPIHQQVRKLRRETGEQVLDARDRESVVVKRDDVKPVVWACVGGKRICNRMLPQRNDLLNAGFESLALAVLAWFTTENEALAAYQEFHDVWVKPLVNTNIEFQVTGEQVLDWLIQWREDSKETQS